MSSNDNHDKHDKHDNSPPKDLKDQDPRVPGKEAHGGDVAPPNSDDAGRRRSPESGPPDKH